MQTGQKYMKKLETAKSENKPWDSLHAQT